MPKRLSDLLCHLAYSAHPADASLSAFAVRDIAYSSAKAGDGVLFVCIEGARADGHDFAADAYARGTRSFVVSRLLPLPADAVQILVADPREALASLSASFFDHPERALQLIGVTGTKGKSTVCEMISTVLNRNGVPTGTIGTIGVRFGDVLRPTRNTTPESYELMKSLAEMRDAGIRAVAMEVSSQGIKQGRIHGIFFRAAVLTNLSPDHIGAMEHPDFAEYKACKMELFRHAEEGFFNADDPSFAEFIENATCKIHTYALLSPAELTARAVLPVRTENAFGISYEIHTENESAAGYLPMPGTFSAYNALAAVGVCRTFGVSLSDAVRALSDCSVVGRFEVVPTARRDISFVIDYAHNGESLRAALAALKRYAPTRLICLFGAVGERTKLRRREMGAAASEYADFCILTDDNPGAEPSMEIIREIEETLRCPHIAIPDRADAIRYAVSHAKPGDIVLLAGKGHERDQLIAGKQVPFSEREILLSETAAEPSETV